MGVVENGNWLRFAKLLGRAALPPAAVEGLPPPMAHESLSKRNRK
jgi:hypothetical protein